jgi:uncharacterized protein
MAVPPASVAAFLAGKRFAVAGVSRDSRQPANAIYRKLKATGYEVIPVNPNAAQIEGAPCYPDLRSIPGALDGLMIASHPVVAMDLIGPCKERGVGKVWFHRSFGQGSVSEDAVEQCKAAGIDAIVGGCPLMYCEPVDVFHRCMCWWLRRAGRVPAS